MSKTNSFTQGARALKFRPLEFFPKSSDTIYYAKYDDMMCVCTCIHLHNDMICNYSMTGMFAQRGAHLHSDRISYNDILTQRQVFTQ